MRRVCRLFLMLTILVLLVPASARSQADEKRPTSQADEKLPTDPALVTGQLPNGLRYIIRPHTNPQGRVSIWLHVSSGSLNETDSTRGLAHYLEHMAFNGSANFPPGSVVPFFQSLGLAFGRDQNAFTSFDQTTYQLALPGGGRDVVDKGMLFMSDVALRLSLEPAGIESERGVILEEKRARSSARQRIQDQVYAQVAPESTVGRRLPIGSEATIKSVTPDDFRDYYARWYVPSNMTVIVVGDTDPAMVVDVITKHFGGGPTVPEPTPRDVGIKPTAGPRAIVATDPELTRAEVSIARLDLPREPTTTVAQSRRELVEMIGAWAFNRRMSARGRGGGDGLPRGERLHSGLVAHHAHGDPVGVGPARHLARHAERAGDRAAARAPARLHGRRGPGRADDADRRRRGNGAAGDHAPGARGAPRDQQRRDAPDAVDVRGPEPRAAPAASSRHHGPRSLRRLRCDFDPTRALFIAELPSNDGAPSEADLVALGRTAIDVTPDKPAEVARATSLLAALPTGGTVVESVPHPASGVTSMWLDNGVRVHHRQMDQRRNEASVSITLAGGAIEETAANRGITEAARRAWERPASSTLTSTQIRDLMTGAKVRVRSHAGGDTLTLTVSGDVAELERGLQLAYLLLTDPVLEAAALEQWKDVETQRIAERKSQPMQVLMDASMTAIYPAGETRPKSLTADQVRAIARPAAQAWLKHLIVDAPIEVAVVGDVDRETATRLVSRYVGALPARPRIGDKTLWNLRAIARPQGPIRVGESIDALTPQAAVLSGFFGADLRNIRDTRLLNMAARVLSTRMHKTIRQDKQLVYSIRASSDPAVVYPGFGFFVAIAPTEPVKAQALAAAVEDTYAEFAKDGPTPDELAVARKQMENLLDEEMKTPDFWLGRLANLDYRGLGLDDLLQAPSQYQQFTAKEIQEAFVRHDRPEARFRVVITPRS